MLKIVRLYNRNRKTIWLWLIIAIFCIAIVNLIQYAYTEQSRKLAEKAANQTITLEEKENPSEVVDYNEAAQSITAGGAVEEDIKDEVQGVLEQFIKYITNKQIEQAYSLLTEDCKTILYPTLEGFEQKYCQDLYEKIYDFQSWSSTDNTYVYQVRFYENMLSAGLDFTNHYLEDYITVLKKGDVYKVNIHSLIKAEKIRKTAESNKVKFKINDVETYLDEEIYEIEVTNDSSKEIILDTREKDNSVYVKNSDGLKIQALLYENTDEELKIPAGETKTIKIKFNNTYNGEKRIISLGFSDIIIDQALHQEDQEKGKMEIEIKL